MAVNTRILAGSLAAAVVISIGGGYLLSRQDDAGDAGSDSDVAVLDPATASSINATPQIPTNRRVQGDPLPTVDLVDQEGNTVSTADLVGHPLVINIWSVTCEACKTEMPAMARVQSEYGDRVQFLFVNTLENTDSALDFAAEHGVSRSIYSDHDGELTSALGVTGLPYTLFVDADGTIVAQKGIALDDDTIRSAIVDNGLAT